MKQIIASVFFDILSYQYIIVCIFKSFELNLKIITARVYKLRLAEVNFLSCYHYFTLRHGIYQTIKNLKIIHLIWETH